MEVPKKIREVFERLRIEHEEPLTLKYIRGGYYVYSYYKIYDPELDKQVIKTYYVGKINKEGVFIAALSRQLETLQLSKETIGALEAISTLSKTDSIILRCLSMNSKMERKKIAKLVEMSEVTVTNRIEKLNRSFNIKYTAEVNLKKLGFLRYIAFIKFEDKIPKIDEIKEAFEDDPRVLLVAMLKGKYDMMLYFTVENDIPLMDFIYKWRMEKLKSYKAEWYITAFSQIYGGTVIREKFFELLKDKLWHRTKETPHKLPTQISTKEYLVLKELCSDANRTFKDISIKVGFESPTESNYIFEKLKERGIIDGLTISMTKLPIKYHVLFYLKFVDYETYSKYREKEVEGLIAQYYHWINKYLIIGDIGTPDGTILIAPILNENDVYKYEDELEKIEGIKTDTLIITDIPIGDIIYRNFDNMYSRIYDILIVDYKRKQEEKIKYS
ncbi:MAG: hypothetical protein ACP5LH_02845 [Candidatus Micrarchaeia archaeon]